MPIRIMRTSVYISLFSISFLSLIIAGCKDDEFNCSDPQIQPSFIKFSSSDIDTFVLRKFKAGDNFQTLLDTFTVVYGRSGQYNTSHDTTTVFINDGKNGIKAGFDWHVYIPAKNKLVSISAITSETKTGKCRSGIFSLDKFGCTCANKVFSVKMDNQVISFSNSDTTRYTIYIGN